MSASGRTGAIPFLLGHVSIQTTERYFGAARRFKMTSTAKSAKSRQTDRRSVSAWRQLAITTRPQSINQFDFHRLLRDAAQSKARVFKACRPDLLFWVIGSAIAFFGYSYKILVQLLVHILAVEHAHGVNTIVQIHENNLRTQGLRINVGCLDLGST